MIQFVGKCVCYGTVDNLLLHFLCAFNFFQVTVHLIRLNERQMLMSELQNINRELSSMHDGVFITAPRNFPITLDEGEEPHILRIRRLMKNGSFVTLRMDIRRYGVALLNKLFKAWKDHNIRVNYLKSVINHCMAIVEHVAHIDSN